MLLFRNPLRSIVNVSLLSLCPNLVKLSTKETPVSKYQGYRKIVKEFIPNLKKLDGKILNDDGSASPYIDINFILDIYFIIIFFYVESVEESLDDVNDESYKSLDGNLKTDDTASCSIEVSSLTEPSSEDNDDNSPVPKLTEDFVSNHVSVQPIHFCYRSKVFCFHFLDFSMTFPGVHFRDQKTLHCSNFFLC